MSTVEERKDISTRIEEIIPICCNGNKSAEDYLRKLFYVVRILDDLYDEDVEVNKKDLTRVFFIMGGELNQNSFFKENHDALTALQVTGFNAWEDANEWEKDDDISKREHSLIIKDFICELFAFVAFLTGGYKLMRKTSPIVRELFIKHRVE